MTPKERADYVAMQVIALAMTSSSSIPIRDLIAAEIFAYAHDAVEEAKHIRCREFGEEILSDIDKARAEALGQAAEIAEDHNGCVDIVCLRDSNCGATIANQIRALVPKEKP